MPDQVTTPAPTPAEIVRVMCDDRLREAARGEILSQTVREIVMFQFGLAETEDGVHFLVRHRPIDDPDLRLAVRVLRHLEAQEDSVGKTEVENG